MKTIFNFTSGKDRDTPNHHCNYQTCLGQGRRFQLDEFEGLYREHMFLHHPLVPPSVKQSQSEVIDIKDLTKKEHPNEVNTSTLVKYLSNFNNYSVIRLKNVHRVTIEGYLPPAKNQFNLV